jgi:ribosome-associated translation inhibitor RaiA
MWARHQTNEKGLLKKELANKKVLLNMKIQKLSKESDYFISMAKKECEKLHADMCVVKERVRERECYLLKKKKAKFDDFMMKSVAACIQTMEQGSEDESARAKDLLNMFMRRTSEVRSFVDLFCKETLRDGHSVQKQLDISREILNMKSFIEKEEDTTVTHFMGWGAGEEMVLVTSANTFEENCVYLDQYAETLVEGSKNGDLEGMRSTMQGMITCEKVTNDLKLQDFLPIFADFMENLYRYSGFDGKIVETIAVSTVAKNAMDKFKLVFCLGKELEIALKFKEKIEERVSKMEELQKMLESGEFDVSEERHPDIGMNKSGRIDEIREEQRKDIVDLIGRMKQMRVKKRQERDRLDLLSILDLCIESD